MTIFVVTGMFLLVICNADSISQKQAISQSLQEMFFALGLSRYLQERGMLCSFTAYAVSS